MPSKAAPKKAAKPAAKAPAKAPAKPAPKAPVKAAPKVAAKAPVKAPVKGAKGSEDKVPKLPPAPKEEPVDPSVPVPKKDKSSRSGREALAMIEILKDGHFFIARTDTEAGAKEYKNTVFEDLLTEMLITLQEQLNEK